MFGRTKAVLASEIFELKQRQDATDKNISILFQYLEETNDALKELRRVVAGAMGPPAKPSHVSEQRKPPRAADPFDDPFFTEPHYGYR
jgi:hypothetical protein